MLDHIHVTDEKMQQMCEALKRLGIAEDMNGLPKIDRCEIVSTAEELARMEEGTTEDPGYLKER